MINSQSQNYNCSNSKSNILKGKKNVFKCVFQTQEICAEQRIFLKDNCKHKQVERNTNKPKQRPTAEHTCQTVYGQRTCCCIRTTSDFCTHQKTKTRQTNFVNCGETKVGCFKRELGISSRRHTRIFESLLSLVSYNHTISTVFQFYFFKLLMTLTHSRKQKIQQKINSSVNSIILPGPLFEEIKIKYYYVLYIVICIK